MSHAAVVLRDVNKWYSNKYHALRNINLEVNAGERIVLCGPSGSGKSTLIRCINQLEQHQSGKIVVNDIELGKSKKDIEKIRCDVGMVFQSFNLFPHLSVLENCVLAPCKVRNTPRKEAAEAAQQCLAQVRMSEHLHKYPAQLSGGQQQRVAIARALCMQPKIMLFDEPTSALDPEMIGEVLEIMVNLVKQTGMTMLCVTHEMGFARQVADRMIFMDNGEILESSAPEVFFKNPSHERVKMFLKQLIH